MNTQRPALTPVPAAPATPTAAAPAPSETPPPARRAVRTTLRDAQRQRAEAPRADPKQDTTQLLKPAPPPSTRAAQRLADAGSTGIRGRHSPMTAAADPRPAERSSRTGARRGPTAS